MGEVSEIHFDETETGALFFRGFFLQFDQERMD